MNEPVAGEIPHGCADAEMPTLESVVPRCKCGLVGRKHIVVGTGMTLYCGGFEPAEKPVESVVPTREKRLTDALQEIVTRIHRIKPLQRLGNENIIADIAQKALES